MNCLQVQKAERDTIKEEKNTLRQTASADIKVFPRCYRQL